MINWTDKELTDLLHDLAANHAAIGRDVSIYSRALAMIEKLNFELLELTWPRDNIKISVNTPDGRHRCRVCGWPLAQTAKEGCVDGNCITRPVRSHAMNNTERIEKSVRIGLRYGQIDGAHHKTWVIDQMLRALLCDGYKKAIEEHNGPDGEYDWDEGIAP